MRIPAILLAPIAVLVAAMLMTAGCTGTPPANATPAATTVAGTAAATATPTAGPAANETAVPTVNVTANQTSAASVNASFVNATWAWIARAGSEPVTVTSPDRYTVRFSANGTYALRADCNSGAGNFSVNGTKIALGPATITQVYCGDRSLDQAFLAALGGVTAYETDAQGRLVLLMTSPNERLVFRKVA
ncbi:MAG TPA: META domain-containing protein [Methanoregulaceae archaeon]|nr:META domain-containing protein [Methanoregulaceae archaeon]HOV67738.1 META domain-containing protein [Methanoregulaceae archaeon]HQJ87870.1 META domain-containing protein [Methanoregulaceae archaeon]